MEHVGVACGVSVAGTVVSVGVEVGDGGQRKGGSGAARDEAVVGVDTLSGALVGPDGEHTAVVGVYCDARIVADE